MIPKTRERDGKGEVPELKEDLPTGKINGRGKGWGGETGTGTTTLSVRVLLMDP